MLIIKMAIHVGEQGVNGKFLYLPLNFTMTLKLLSKKLFSQNNYKKNFLKIGERKSLNVKLFLMSETTQ